MAWNYSQGELGCFYFDGGVWIVMVQRWLAATVGMSNGDEWWLGIMRGVHFAIRCCLALIFHGVGKPGRGRRLLSIHNDRFAACHLVKPFLDFLERGDLQQHLLDWPE